VVLEERSPLTSPNSADSVSWTPSGTDRAPPHRRTAPVKRISRRTAITGSLGASALTLAACGNRTAPTEAGTVPPPSPLAPKAGRDVVTQTLTAAPTTVDLGGRTVSTWAYGERSEERRGGKEWKGGIWRYADK